MRIRRGSATVTGKLIHIKPLSKTLMGRRDSVDELKLLDSITRKPGDLPRDFFVTAPRLGRGRTATGLFYP